MAEPSIINPDKNLNFQRTPAIRGKYPIRALNDTEFSPHSDELVHPLVTLNLTQPTENIFLKSSGLMNFHCEKGIRLRRPTNLGFIFGGSGRYAASVIPGTIKSPPVRKAADTPPGNDNEPNQNLNNSNDNGDGAAQPNNDADNNEADATHKDGGDTGGGNGNGDDGSNDDDGSGEDDEDDGANVKIHRFDVGFFRRKIIITNMYAIQYGSWRSFARAILHIWLRLNVERSDYPPRSERANVHPSMFWPGCLVAYGRIEDDGLFYKYDWNEFEWDVVESQIKDILVLDAA